VTVLFENQLNCCKFREWQ